MRRLGGTKIASSVEELAHVDVITSSSGKQMPGGRFSINTSLKLPACSRGLIKLFSLTKQLDLVYPGTVSSEFLS